MLRSSRTEVNPMMWLRFCLFLVLAGTAFWVAPAALAKPGESQARKVAPPAQSVPILLLIHGRDQAVATRSQVELAWNRAIDDGLKAASSPASIATERRRFYWYADTLAKSTGCRFAAVGGESYVARGWSVMPTLRDLLAGIADQVPANVQRMVVNQLMEDTSKYLGNGSVACAVDEGLRELWAETSVATPIVVVAHSMGSMVLYKNLMNKLQDSEHPVYLLTIGSMVGNPTVQKTLLGSLAAYPAPVPLPVVWWRNFINDGDKLAFSAATSFTSQTVSKRPIDVRLKFGPSDPHAATAYMASTTFGAALGEIWCELATADRACKG
jgi:hypothetical protein